MSELVSEDEHTELLVSLWTLLRLADFAAEPTNEPDWSAARVLRGSSELLELAADLPPIPAAGLSRPTVGHVTGFLTLLSEPPVALLGLTIVTWLVILPFVVVVVAGLFLFGGPNMSTSSNDLSMLCYAILCTRLC